MTECSHCGAELTPHHTRCPVCGRTTIYYHRQRRCMHCGAPAAANAKTCMMCGRPVDHLPLSRSIFSGSWLGIFLGVLIVVGLVVTVNYYQSGGGQPAQAALQTPTATSSPTAPATSTFTPGPPPTPTPTAIATVTPTPTPRVHVIEPGETLIYIAQLYGVTVDELVEYNNIEDERNLKVGQEILIPPPSGRAAADTRDELPPSVVYVVQEGDTLLDIALRYGATIEGIASVNPDVNLDLIFPGQELVIPLPTPTATPTPTASPTPTPTPGPPYPPPVLLSPSDGHIVDEPSLVFNWTASGLLGEDEYYVLQLIWPDGTRSEYWTRATSQRVSVQSRSGLASWTVAVMRRTGVAANGAPVGEVITPGAPPRSVRVRK